MKRLRYSLAALIGGLTFLFNVERLDLGEVNIIDISSFVSLLGFLSAVSAILFAFPLWKGSRSGAVVVFWIVVYLVNKQFIFDDRPLWGGIHTYITITEVAMLSVLLGILHQLTQGLHEFEAAVATLTLTGVNRKVRALVDAETEIQDRMLLSRRHKRPMSVVVFEADPEGYAIRTHRVVEEVQRGMANRYMIATLANVVLANLRRTDLPLEQGANGRFVVVCPETDAGGARAVARNVERAVKAALGVDLDYGVASFPDNAVTFDELMCHAERDIRDDQPLTPTPEPAVQS